MTRTGPTAWTRHGGLRRTRTVLAALVVVGGPASAQRGPAPATAIAGARQLVVVTSASWDAVPATLRRYERPTAGAAWRAVGPPVPVTLGRTGLAWGIGAGAAPAGAPVKREGDGRSPAGVFPLVAAFGYGDGDQPMRGRLPYHPVVDGTVCVDDAASPLYNVVVDSGAVPGGRWTSAEHMRRVDGYRQGVVVGYNGGRVGPPAGDARARGAHAGTAPRPGSGSCIFLHGWAGPDRPTEGCTAMDAPALAAVVAWLDPDAHPVLVQFPAPVAGRYRAAWRVP